MISSAPHIFTLTGNLLAERTLEFECWSPGRTQRAVRETFQVGGKGINVSKMLTRLGVANTALCFSGGAPGDECETWLAGHGFTGALRTFRTSTPTRAGTVVRDRSGTQAETTFLGPDAAPDETGIAACAEFLNTRDAGNVLALCGSFPGWSTPAFASLRTAIDRWFERGTLVADTYGPPLAALVQRPLSLLKINQDELRSLGITAVESIPRHIQRVIITDGPRAIHMRDSDGATTTFNPPAIREVSPTGSGDVLLACVLEALFMRKLPLAAAVAFAIPYAAANAAHPGVAEFPLPLPHS
jgi:fructose-1-phosphate kinase PfkB-like protein